MAPILRVFEDGSEADSDVSVEKGHVCSVAKNAANPRQDYEGQPQSAQYDHKSKANKFAVLQYCSIAELHARRRIYWDHVFFSVSLYLWRGCIL